MKYCRRCLYPANHPLTITFDAEGVCSGCRVHEEKDQLDWQERRQALRRLLSSYRNRSGSNYDCIVPVSGGRDSYFIVHMLKRELGMNPLLVSYNRHYNTRRGLRNLAYLRTIFDCDLYSMLLSSKLVKTLTRRMLELRGSIHWHTLAGQSVLPVHVAVRYKIPLIVWGAHQGLDQVGMFSHLDEVEMTRRYRKDHDLMGLEAEDIVSAADGLPERDLRPFYYPHDKQIEAVGVRGIYLGNYIRWDSKAQHERMIRAYGYETALQQRTFDTYNDVDCQHYSGLHDWIKFTKFGFGKVTDHASREIRLKRLGRDDAVALVRDYSHRRPADLDNFLAWLEIGEQDLFECIDRFRDPKVWSRRRSVAWTLTHSVENEPAGIGKDVALPVEGDCSFEVTPSRDPSADESEGILLHRGYIDGAPARFHRDAAHEHDPGATSL